MSYALFPKTIEVWGLPEDLSCLVGSYNLTDDDVTKACYTRVKEGQAEADYFLYFVAENRDEGRWNMGDTQGSEIG